ncbi:hypothetical protein PMAYCL1PPCAC_21475, partial [Pristionchus mayeri]
VALSNVSDKELKKFAHIADDLFIQLQSFCVPLLLRNRAERKSYQMTIHSWILIAVASFSIGGIYSFASTYPAEATEELLMFFNSTFPERDAAFHQKLLNWAHNWAPYGSGLAAKLFLDFDQKSTMLVSLGGLAVSFASSLIAVLIPQGTIWQGCILLLSRNLIVFFASLGFDAAAIFCGD